MGALRVQNFDFKSEYPNLEETPLHTSVIYGPVQSRRFGSSLGINLSGNVPKLCTFDCPYCDLGVSEVRLNRIKKDIVFPTPNEVAQLLTEKIKQLQSEGVKLNQISFSGNGEPTLHPDFPEVVAAVMEVKNSFLLDVKVSLLTSGSTLDSRRLVEAANKLDERMIKIDAGNEKVFKKVNAPLTRTTLAKILANVRPLKDCIVQSFFVRGSIDNTGQQDIEDWIEVIGLIKPKQVHIHGMSRVPASSGLIRVDEDSLYTIASRLERKTQIKSLVFP